MQPRFQHILVPLDFTEHNRTALEVAIEMAVQNRARVTLLHVIESIEGSDDSESREFMQQLHQKSESELEVLAQPFEAAGVSVDRKVREGRRTAEIVQDAAERKADLIVMSSHPINPADPMKSLGTISYQVSILCSCPVLLVKSSP